MPAASTNPLRLLRLLLALVCAALVTRAAGHGLMIHPNPRGALNDYARFIPEGEGVSDDAPIDWQMHFPAGVRDLSYDTSGLLSQKRAAYPQGWTPFEPLKPGFRWRAGVCGDPKNSNLHLRGGKFYFDAFIAATYAQGQDIDVRVAIAAHHNGFMELHVCDVDKCGGELNEDCFTKKDACFQMERAPNPICDDGWNKKCGPIDSNYPGRWYLPCSSFGLIDDERWEIFGGTTMKYRLPPHLNCKHCMLSWFWTAANTCNPPGVVEYFTGEDRPKNWGTCKGQAGAIGGYTSVQKPCGGSRFPEEYLQCADITILPGTAPVRGGTKAPPTEGATKAATTAPVDVMEVLTTKATTVTPRAPMMKAKATTTAATKPKRRTKPRVEPRREDTDTQSTGGSPRDRYDPMAGGRNGHSDIFDLVLIGDGARILSLNRQPRVDVSEFSSISVEAITRDSVKSVAFYIGGSIKGKKATFVDDKRPFYLFGDGADGIRPWTNPPLNRRIVLRAVGGRDRDSIAFMLVKK